MYFSWCVLGGKIFWNPWWIIYLKRKSATLSRLNFSLSFSTVFELFRFRNSCINIWRWKIRSVLCSFSIKKTKTKINLADRLTNFFHDYKIRQDSEQSSVNRRRLLQHAISNTDFKKNNTWTKKQVSFSNNFSFKLGITKFRFYDECKSLFMPISLSNILY